MIDYIKEIEKPDDEEVFIDGFLYIITRNKDNGKYGIKVVLIDPCYDEPMTLADIAVKYPDVFTLIFKAALHGAVYDYKNHHEYTWEKIGETRGYA